MATHQPTDESVQAQERRMVGQKIRAYSVHLYTASGIVFAFLATAELCAPQPDPRWVFVWLIVTGLIDATDGPLARRWQVKRLAPRIAGRTIDDIVDYLTFTFIPLLLVWRMQWLPPPAELWVVLAMIASLFGFANMGAKQEEDGFFFGFPSYWNIVAFYIGVWFTYHGPIMPAVVIALLSVLTFLPVRFLYPNLAPPPWRRLLLVGGLAWVILLLAMLPGYPAAPLWVMWLSLLYPVGYTLLSVYLDWRMRAHHVSRPPK